MLAGARSDFGMARNVIAVMLTFAMLATASVIAVELAALSGTPSPFSAAENPRFAGVDQTSLVEAFYDAVNRHLAGEDSLLLATIASPRIAVHVGEDPDVRGPVALLKHLDGLRQRGQVSLHFARLIGDGSEVAAVVEARAPASDEEDRSDRGPLLWRTIDLFRIEAGMIAAWWPGTIELPPSPPLPAATVRVPSGDAGISLSRLELSAGTDGMSLDAPHPQVFLVESGAFAISREQRLAVSHAGDITFTTLDAAPGGDDLLLRPGDALFLPARSPVDIRNGGTAGASALSLLVAPRAQLLSQVHAMPNDLVTVMVMHDAWRIGRRVTWKSGAVSETLAVSLRADEDGTGGPLRLSGNPVTLDPGQRLPPLPPGDLRFAIVRSGVLSVSELDRLAEPTRVPGTIQQTVMAGSSAVDAASHLFWAGDVFAIEAGEAPVFENAGATRLDVLLVEIAVERDEGAPFAEEATPSPPGS
jgi:hypothetical protein